MKILLVNPPFYRFMGLEQDYVPLSLLAVGSQLIKEGHDVKLKNLEIHSGLTYKGYKDRVHNFDNFINNVNSKHEVWDEFEKTLDDFKPDKVGITVLSVKYKSALRIIDILKKRKISIFVGGPHIMTHQNCFDNEIEIIKGEFESRNTKTRIKNLDDLPMPNFDILLDSYSPQGYSHIVSSRGCPYLCKFCASNTMWDRKVSFKSPRRIIDEMNLIHKKFKNTSFTFWDETFTVNKKRLKEFCSSYDLNVKWNCDTRADVLDEETVSLMKNAGCEHISLGIESGKQHILDSIGKNETLENFKTASALLNKYKIQWKAYCIIGFPQENENDMFETINFIKSLSPFRITLSFFTPYKGTELYDYCLEKNLIDYNYDATVFSHQSPHNYFCEKVSKERYNEIREIISNDVDEYNKNAIAIWK